MYIAEKKEKAEEKKEEAKEKKKALDDAKLAADIAKQELEIKQKAEADKLEKAQVAKDKADAEQVSKLYISKHFWTRNVGWINLQHIFIGFIGGCQRESCGRQTWSRESRKSTFTDNHYYPINLHA